MKVILTNYIPFNVSKITCFYLDEISLVQIIEAKLRKILNCSSFANLGEVRLSRCKNYTSISYQSAIALSLASKTGSNSLDIAKELVKLLTKTNPEKAPNLDIAVSVLGSGMLEFKVENINIYLENLPKNLIASQDKKEINKSKNQRSFIITRVKISGLEPDQLCQTEEKKIISEIITVMDNIHEEKKHLKLATNLTKTFWEFERYCRIFGEVKRSNLPLAQARLGLVYLTYLILIKLSEGG
jgi:hypothetical protein